MYFSCLFHFRVRNNSCLEFRWRPAQMSSIVFVQCFGTSLVSCVMHYYCLHLSTLRKEYFFMIQSFSPFTNRANFISYFSYMQQPHSILNKSYSNYRTHGYFGTSHLKISERQRFLNHLRSVACLSSRYEMHRHLYFYEFELS